jgi:feruloyl esterase
MLQKVAKSAENFQPKVTHAAALAVLSASLLMPACRASGNTASTHAARQTGATSPMVTAQTACTTLSGKAIGGAILTTAVIPASGNVPTYCKVNGTLAPALNFEIRLPEAWNGKLYYAGGGGYDGAITELVVPALTQGYAEVASDSGHQGDGMSAAFAWTDTFAAQLFGSLSVPTVMSTALKAVTAAYGVPPARSYFEGCSNGGREALMAVQRNPNLFDGVIARAPGYNWVGFMGAFNRTAKALAAPGGAFSPAKTALLAKHVREACDRLDGIVDGVVSNPAACTAKVLNVTALRCAGGADTGDTCLSDAQLAVVKSWTTDAVFKGSDTYRSRGYNLTGNEDDPGNFGIWVSGNGEVRKAGQYLFQDTSVKYYLARDPNADSLRYAPWDQNQNALYAMAALNDATQTDIRPFLNSGGKLIVWHGGADAALSVNSTVEYMEGVTNSVGAANVAASTRFYAAPGVNHCGGGIGPDKTDLLTALDQWVTKGIAPATLTAEKLDANGAVTRALPLCQYPQYPKYTGPANDAAAARLASSYTCTSP